MNWYGPKIFPSRASPSKSSKSYCTAIMLRLDSDFQLLLVDMERKPTEKDFFAIDSVIDSIVSLYREYCDRYLCYFSSTVYRISYLVNTMIFCRRLTRKQSEELQAIALSLASTTQQLILQDDYVKIQSAKNIFLGKLNSSHYISTVDFAKVDSLKQLVESDLRPILQGATKTKLVGFTRYRASFLNFSTFISLS